MERTRVVGTAFEPLQQLVQHIAETSASWSEESLHDALALVLQRLACAASVDAAVLTLVDADAVVTDAVVWPVREPGTPSYVSPLPGQRLEDYAPRGSVLLRAGAALPLYDVQLFTMSDREREQCERAGVRAVFHVPCSDDHRLVGIVTLITRDPVDRWHAELGWWCEYTGRLVAGAVRRMRTGQEERRRVARTAAIAAQLPDPLVVVRDGTMQWASPSWERVLGWAPQRLVGSAIDEVDPSGAISEVCALMALDPQVAPVPTEVLVRTGAGEEIWCEARFAAVDMDDEIEVMVVLRDVHLRRLRIEHLRTQAATDPLTGLLNRIGLWERFGDDTAMLGCALFIDLDDFKLVNDRHGHDAGDGVLRQIADRIRSTIRPEDEAARIGGDEFVVLLGGRCEVQAAERIAERLVAAIAAPLAVGAHEVMVTASVGVSAALAGAEPGAVLSTADQAMYEAKRLGKGMAVVFEGETGRVRAISGDDRSADFDLGRDRPLSELEAKAAVQP